MDLKAQEKRFEMEIQMKKVDKQIRDVETENTEVKDQCKLIWY